MAEHGIVSERIPSRSEQRRALGRTRLVFGRVRRIPRSARQTHPLRGARDRLGAEPGFFAARYDDAGVLQVLLSVGKPWSRPLHAPRQRKQPRARSRQQLSRSRRRAAVGWRVQRNTLVGSRPEIPAALQRNVGGLPSRLRGEQPPGGDCTRRLHRPVVVGPAAGITLVRCGPRKQPDASRGVSARVEDRLRPRSRVGLFRRPPRTASGRRVEAASVGPTPHRRSGWRGPGEEGNPNGDVHCPFRLPRGGFRGVRRDRPGGRLPEPRARRVRHPPEPYLRVGLRANRHYVLRRSVEDVG